MNTRLWLEECFVGLLQLLFSSPLFLIEVVSRLDVGRCTVELELYGVTSRRRSSAPSVPKTSQRVQLVEPP